MTRHPLPLFTYLDGGLAEICGDGTDDDPLTGRLPGVHRDARSESQLDNRAGEQHRIAAQMLGSMGEAQKMMLVVLVA
jgi:hypothetical protein